MLIVHKICAALVFAAFAGDMLAALAGMTNGAVTLQINAGVLALKACVGLVCTLLLVSWARGAKQ